ncbi:Sushi domain-containing protein [Aphelenchoides fujianensis]|nr:Sushi domain-containing protein [Aphelenchoides fujianensis]
MEIFFPQPNKTVYRVGESVAVYCLYGRVHENNKTLMNFNCTSGGRWDSTAAEKRCYDVADLPKSGCPLFPIDSSKEIFFPTPNQTTYSAGQQVTVVCRYGEVNSGGKARANFVCAGNGWKTVPTVATCGSVLNRNSYLASAQAAQKASTARASTTTRTATTTGCGQSTTSGAPQSTTSLAYCPQISLNLQNTIYPESDSSVLSGSKAAGTIVVQVCSPGFWFSGSQSPVNIYQAMHVFGLVVGER